MPFDQDISGPSANVRPVEDEESRFAGRSPYAGLRRLVRLVKRGSDLVYSRVSGLSGFEWRILTEVCDAPGQSINDLGKESDRSVAQVSRTVSRLVELGLLQREHVPGGHRVAIHPTSFGIDQAKLLSGAHANLEQKLKVGISDLELATFQRVLSIMMENATLSISHETALTHGRAPEM